MISLVLHFVITTLHCLPRKNRVAMRPPKLCVSPCNTDTRPNMNMQPDTENRMSLYSYSSKNGSNPRQTCGFSRFINAFAGISNRMYGAKLLRGSKPTKKLCILSLTYKTTNAVLYSLPTNLRSCFNPKSAALDILTLWSHLELAWNYTRAIPPTDQEKLACTRYRDRVQDVGQS